MHSRREDAFKEGLGGIQEELMRTRKHTMCFIIRFHSDCKKVIAKSDCKAISKSNYKKLLKFGQNLMIANYISVNKAFL